MVDKVEYRRFNELRFHNVGFYRQNRLAREHESAFRHGVNVAVETERLQIFEKRFIENIKRIEVSYIVVGKFEIDDIFYHLLKPRRNRIGY